MVDNARLEPRSAQPGEMMERLDRMFEDMARMLPMMRPLAFARDWHPADMVHVDEFYDGDELVIRAELPGIDPDRDVELRIADGMLHIDAERRDEKESEERGYVRREMHYGKFSRSLPLPDGVTDTDVQATYKDGLLEVRLPAPRPEPAKRIAIAKN